MLCVLLQESTSSELGAVCVSERHSQVISQQKQTIKDLRQKLKDLKEAKPPSELYNRIMYVRTYIQYVRMYIIFNIGSHKRFLYCMYSNNCVGCVL